MTGQLWYPAWTAAWRHELVDGEQLRHSVKCACNAQVLMWDVRRMNSGAASSALSFGAQGPYAHALLRTFDLPTLVSSCDMEAAGPGSSHGGRGASTLSLLQLVGGW